MHPAIASDSPTSHAAICLSASGQQPRKKGCKRASYGKIGSLPLEFEPRLAQGYGTNHGSPANGPDLSAPLDVHFQWTGPDIFTLAWLPANTVRQAEGEEAGR